VRGVRLVLAPVVGAEGSEVAPGGLTVGAASLAANGVAHPAEALTEDEARPEDGIQVRRRDGHYDKGDHECHECDVEDIGWARVKEGAKRFDLLIAPAGGDDAVLQAGVCEQGEGNAEDNRRKY
jgi:hypothetical protein